MLGQLSFTQDALIGGKKIQLRIAAGTKKHFGAEQLISSTLKP